MSKDEGISPGTSIVTVTATDPDKGDIITYSWGGSSAVFTLDKNSGTILLAGNLDREQTAFYSLTITASDGVHEVSETVAITVTDVNDNAPRFQPNTYTYAIAFNAS